MTVLDTIWDIDCVAMFASYKNFALWHKLTDSPYAGLVWGRPDRKQIVQVLFVSAENMNVAIAEFLASALSADLELVGNLAVEGLTTPVVSLKTPIFTINATHEILQRGDINGFLDMNGMLNATQFTNQGLSIWAKVGLEFNLRVGNEVEDLKGNAKTYLDDLERIVFINQDKGIVLSRRPEKEVIAKVLDEHAKGATQYKDSMEFVAYHSLTRNTKNDTEDQKMVPIVRITRDGTKYTSFSAVFTVVIPAFCGDNSNTIYNRFQEGLRRRVQSIVYININRMNKQKPLATTTSAVFYPPGWSTLIHLQLPQGSDAEMKTFRVQMHKLLNLSAFSPCLRLAQQVPFGGAAACRLLRTPHTAINNYKPLGKVSVVRGPYNYHHYMQDNFDDNGWGCAYRSLQTIWSWFVLNGYCDKPVPSHREIQQCLVKIGDKEEKFIGSRRWIGSMEIGFVLDELLGVESRFLSSSIGADVPEHARALAHHFDTAGSPVMIGGGQLAHTILGVDFDDNTGDCRFLVLDPHYTGSEDIRTVTTKGWCQWKPADFFKAPEHYNMALPQPPADAI